MMRRIFELDGRPKEVREFHEVWHLAFTRSERLPNEPLVGEHHARNVLTVDHPDIPTKRHRHPGHRTLRGNRLETGRGLGRLYRRERVGRVD
ncbi:MULTISPECIES: hypothetical protein [Mycobacteriales]|uniref:Uncharacterized protein n=1 Tax=Gordonia rubripertincta TaxID=36822 RepID=A0ABT4MPJ8_GORRU|nr:MULTISPECIES: hypothetical protein [Mycobacteriales]MCZ4548908.1 hypothetical protein [Gordonia rubripertincta]